MESEASAFLLAAKAGDHAQLQRLHASSAAPRELCAARAPGVSSAGHSALHWAAAGGHAEAVGFLLGCEGTQVNLCNNGGSTPLHSAAANGHAAEVRKLIEAGAKPSIKDTEGQTPFDVAAARGHADAAREIPASSSHAFLRVAVGPASGELVMKLYETVAPRACANFLGLCAGFGGLNYEGSRFHRLLPGQVLQGGILRGCPAETPRSIFGGAFADEAAGLRLPQDRRGLLCCANSGPDSNGSQFYLTLDATPHLDGRHVVFGCLVYGDPVLALAESTPLTDAGKPSRPLTIQASGRWPPPAADERVEGSAAPVAVTLQEVHSVSSKAREGVADAISQGLKRASQSGADDGTADGASGSSSKMPRAVASMWDALLMPSGDGDSSSSDEEGEEGEQGEKG